MVNQQTLVECPLRFHGGRNGIVAPMRRVAEFSTPRRARPMRRHDAHIARIRSSPGGAWLAYFRRIERRASGVGARPLASYRKRRARRAACI